MGGRSSKEKQRAAKERYYAKHGPEVREKARLRAKKRRQDPVFAERSRLAQTEYRNTHPRETFGAIIKSRFGLTLQEYEAMERAQGGVCAICGNPETSFGRNGKLRRLSIDHDHVTHDIRGLLCANCNSGLGYFKDNPGALRKAALYLEGFWARSDPSDAFIRECARWSR